MAVVVVLTHRVHIGGGQPTSRPERRGPYLLRCGCGWRMGGLKAETVHDAGRLHYATEGHTPIVYRLSVTGEERSHVWFLDGIVYRGEDPMGNPVVPAV